MSKIQWVIERTFGKVKNWFGSRKARYKGLARVHAQHLMKAMSHNLYHSLALLYAVHNNII
ncbi:MAG: transposase [Flavobacteriales bacterium Tduv]